MLGLKPYSVGFASSGADVEERKDGGDDDAHGNNYDEDDEAVGAARGVVVGAGGVAFLDEGGHFVCT